jgi:hypothetical protein
MEEERLPILNKKTEILKKAVQSQFRSSLAILISSQSVERKLLSSCHYVKVKICVSINTDSGAYTAYQWN